MRILDSTYMTSVYSTYSLGEDENHIAFIRRSYITQFQTALRQMQCYSGAPSLIKIAEEKRQVSKSGWSNEEID